MLRWPLPTKHIEGVMACNALASTGGVEGSFFTAQRCSPWLSRHSQGDSNVTGGGVSAAALERRAIAAIVSVVVPFFCELLFGRRISVPKRKAKQIPENTPVDLESLIQQVLRESYLQTTEDLRFYAEKVRYFNQCKKAIRDYLQKLRDYRVNVISAAHRRRVDLCRGDEKDVRVLAEVFEECAHIYSVGDVEYEMCI